jgi:hypothetical protein
MKTSFAALVCLHPEAVRLGQSGPQLDQQVAASLLHALA